MKFLPESFKWFSRGVWALIERINFLILRFHVYSFLTSHKFFFSPTLSWFLFPYFIEKKHKIHSSKILLCVLLGCIKCLRAPKNGRFFSHQKLQSYLKHFCYSCSLSLEMSCFGRYVDTLELAYLWAGRVMVLFFKGSPHLSSTDFLQKGRDLMGRG